MRPQFRLLIGIALIACLISFSPATANTTRQPITPDNADKLTQIGQLGHGTANKLAWSPDGNILAVSGSVGVALYDAHHLDIEPRFLIGHTAILFDIAFSPDGQLIASASRDGTVRLWDVRSGETRTILTGHIDSVLTVAFSPDGSTLASGGMDSTIRLWDVKTGAESATLKLGRAVEHLAFSPDGNSLAAVQDDITVRVWALKTRKEQTVLRGHHDSVDAVVFSPDGKLIATGSLDRTIRLWDSATGAALATLQGHMSSVVSMVFSPDGKTLAAGADDGRIWLWDTDSRTERRVLRHSSFILSLAYSPNGETLAAVNLNGNINLWNPQNGARGAALQGSFALYRRLIFATDNRTLIATTNMQKLQRWDTQEQKLIATIEQPAESRLLYYSPDRSTFVLAGTTGDKAVAHLLNTVSSQERAIIERNTKNSGFSLAFSSDSAQIAITNSESAVYLSDARTGVSQMKLAVPAKGDLVDQAYHVLFSPDNKTLVALGIRHKKDSSEPHSMIYQWTLPSGEAKPPIELPNGSITDATFGADSKILLIASSKNQIQAWNLETGTMQVRADLNTIVLNNLAMSPDGASLVIFGNDNGKSTIVLLDVESGLVRRRLSINNSGNSIYYIFSPDSKIFAFGEANTIHVLDTQTGDEKTLLLGHTAQVYDIDISPDGTTLATASDDGTIRLWGVK